MDIVIYDLYSPGLRRLRLEDHNFKASLGHDNTLSPKQINACAPAFPHSR